MIRPPAERMQLVRVSARFEAAADLLRPLTKTDDRIGRLSKELERKARETADGIRDMVLLEEVDRP